MVAVNRIFFQLSQQLVNDIHRLAQHSLITTNFIVITITNPGINHWTTINIGKEKAHVDTYGTKVFYTNNVGDFSQTKKSKDQISATIDVFVLYPLVGNPDHSAQTSQVQVLRSLFPNPLCKVLWLKDLCGTGVTLLARILRPSAGRRISHEGLGTWWGPPARSPGSETRCSTLSTTGRNCSRPAGSSTFSCSRPLEQSVNSTA